MNELAEVVGPDFGRHIGFQAVSGLQQMLLREPLQRGERRLLSPGPLTEDEVDRGYVEQYLGFLQSRRLCFLYVLQAPKGGHLELYPQGGKEITKIQMPSNTMVIFRHDQLSYSYVSSGSQALQGWLVALRDRYDLAGLDGDYRGMEEVYGVPSIQGQEIPMADQVNIMTLAPMLPARVSNATNHHLMFLAQTDTFLEIPVLRWDTAVYYTDDPDNYSGHPRSYTKHAGMFPDDEILGFDNEFFNITDKEAKYWPPCLRLCLEKSYESLQLHGYTRESVKGQSIALYNGDIGTEMDPFWGMQEDPDTWATARYFALPSATILSYYLGLRGPALSVDTACSSSLVSSNLLYNYLRKRPDPTVKEAVSAGMLNALSPHSFVGLSGAGMLGRTGRCKSFDNSANGYARGEAVIAAVFKTAEGAEDVENRLANFVSGFVNQDGRSASLTAPNGPSQQLCIRSSHRLAGIMPAEIWCTENHGTGTALGDPIEVGSVRACFARGRDTPLLVTTGKSNQGHSEATAGLSGITKVVNTIRHDSVPSQCHLKFLNAHIDDAGFRAHFPIECCELNVLEKGVIAGLNSFGFGGTNSRGEIWAMSSAIQNRKASEVLGRSRNATVQQVASVTLPCAQCGLPMCFRCGQSMSGNVRNHRCADIREEVGSYEICSNCYTGGFHYQGITDS